MSASFEASLTITSAEGSYGVSIGAGTVKPLLAAGTGAIVADRFFEASLAGERVLTVEAIEDNKTLIAASDLLRDLRGLGLTRGEEILAVGGGIVQDLACFAASVYMRGAPWTYAPTTLLAMVDSCIGGKSSINVSPYKNIVGTFHPPKAIVIDVDFLDTLPAPAIVDGLCEAVKICYARSPERFGEYLAKGALPGAGKPVMAEVIALSLESKKWFIEIDEFDQNERLLLNFGHTFGHAIEAACHFRIAHGAAVGIGMLSAIRFAILSGRLPADHALAGRLREHVSMLLSHVPGIAAEAKAIDMDELVKAFLTDKKHKRDALALILPAVAGGLARIFVPRDESSLSLVARAYAEAFESLPQ